MMPTPEQEARLKMCKSSTEYDAEWQRITNENTKIMVDRAAAELRALREQEYDLWVTDIGFANQRRGMESSQDSNLLFPQSNGDYDAIVGEQVLNEYLKDRHTFKQSLPKIDPNAILTPTPITIKIENKLVVLLAAIISIICILTIIRYTR